MKKDEEAKKADADKKAIMVSEDAKKSQERDGDQAKKQADADKMIAEKREADKKVDEKIKA